jgi:Leucine-rich repeat (LRR) protein
MRSSWGSGSCKDLVDRFEANDPTLTHLVVLPFKKLTSSDIQRLADAIQRGCNSHCLSISASGHAVTPDDAYTLGKALALGSSSVRSLAVGSVDMGDDGALALLRGLMLQSALDTSSVEKSASPLQALDLSYKGLTSRSLGAIISYCYHNPSLTSLNLSRNPQLATDAPDNLFELTDITSHSPCFAETVEINLSQCDLHDDFVVSLSRLFTEASAAYSTSTSTPTNLKLILSDNNGLGAQSIAALSQLSCLTDLSMSGCGCTDDAFASGGLSELKSLDLSNNRIQDATHMSGMLSRMHYLRVLNLSGNPLGSLGCQQVWEACSTKQYTLDVIDLGQTQCPYEVAASFVHHPSLTRKLCLFDNKLGAQGLRAIDLYGGHPTLEYLDLAGNHADESSIVVLLEKLLLVPPTSAQSEESQDTNDTTSQRFPTGSQRACSLQTLVVGGNQGGLLLEDTVTRVQQRFPTLDIPRDVLSKVHKST